MGQADDDTGEDRQEARLEEFIGYQLRMAQILAFRAFEERLTRFGRAPRYLGLLATIRTNPGLSQSKLAEAVALRRSSLVNILDQLEEDGLLLRKASSTDRRRNGIWLTEKGEEIVVALLREARMEDDRMTANLSEGEVGLLGSFLARIIDNLRK